MSKITRIAIDTAKQTFHLVGMSRSQQLVWRKQLSRKQLLPWLSRCEPCVVVLEACGASHHWGRRIRSLGHEAKLLAAQHVKPYRRGQKNDYRDAEAILSASLAPATRFVGIKTEAQQAEQAWHRTRSQLLSRRNATANSLRGMLGEYGLAFGRGHQALREGARHFAATEEAANLGLVPLIEDRLEELDELARRVERYEHEIKRRAKSNPLSARVERELGGVGSLSASALSVRVADPRDFGNGRNFAAFLGLAPSHRGTGGKVRIGHLARSHDPYLRQLMIHGARSVVSKIGDKQDARSCWLRELVARRGFNVACVALAHRNARQAWAILARCQAQQLAA